MHLHVDAMSFFVWVAYFLIYKLLSTLVMARYPESPFSKALGALS
jgi:hypothetical protein